MNVGFPVGTETTYRQRLKLSDFCVQVLSDDRLTFSPEPISRDGFINRVFLNFRNSARASRRVSTEKLIDEAKAAYLAAFPADDPRTGKPLAGFLDDLRTRILSQTDDIPLYDDFGDSVSLLVNLHEETLNVLRGSPEADGYDGYDGRYIAAVLEEYAHLPIIRRLHIYFAKEIELIKSVIREEHVLSAATQFGRYHVLPIGISRGAMDSELFLLCYSRKATAVSEEKVPYQPASLRFTTFKPDSLVDTGIQRRIAKSEREEIMTRMKQTGVPYLLSAPTEITVRLTKEGEKRFRRYAFQRPTAVSHSDEHILTFQCTERQAFNYFVSFGKDAEIIKPDSLKNELQNFYRAALRDTE